MARSPPPRSRRRSGISESAAGARKRYRFEERLRHYVRVATAEPMSAGLKAKLAALRTPLHWPTRGVGSRRRRAAPGRSSRRAAARARGRLRRARRPDRAREQRPGGCAPRRSVAATTGASPRRVDQRARRPAGRAPARRRARPARASRRRRAPRGRSAARRRARRPSRSQCTTSSLVESSFEVVRGPATTTTLGDTAAGQRREDGGQELACFGPPYRVAAPAASTTAATVTPRRRSRARARRSRSAARSTASPSFADPSPCREPGDDLADIAYSRRQLGVLRR